MSNRPSPLQWFPQDHRSRQRSVNRRAQRRHRDPMRDDAHTLLRRAAPSFRIVADAHIRKSTYLDGNGIDGMNVTDSHRRIKEWRIVKINDKARSIQNDFKVTQSTNHRRREVARRKVLAGIRTCRRRRRACCFCDVSSTRDGSRSARRRRKRIRMLLMMIRHQHVR